jgi:hypothetical protein
VAVVEESRIPEIVTATTAFVEVEVVCTIIHVEAEEGAQVSKVGCGGHLPALTHQERSYWRASEQRREARSSSSWALSTRLLSSPGVPVACQPRAP